MRHRAAGRASPAMSAGLSRPSPAGPGRPGTRPGHRRGLSPRETEVVRLVARGRTNTKIAEQLVISVGTVKSHLSGVQNKLTARNRVEIAAWAWEHGLVR
ncbi:response regulator transcription factor, partial [Streptomyces cyaneogriseus]|uniref:response regulator transcription factor n=1 Tax=Streptomyces cyaneogriseus TaxID=68192 RepID=UPI0005C97D6B